MGLYKSGGGGALSETVLWTNSSPTSTFTPQTITLSDSISNYKFLKIRFRKTTTDNTEHEVLYNVDDVISQFTSNVNAFYMACVVERANSSTTNRTALRLFGMSNATTMAISPGIYIDSVGTARNDWVIPLKIIGLK